MGKQQIVFLTDNLPNKTTMELIWKRAYNLVSPGEDGCNELFQRQCIDATLVSTSANPAGRRAVTTWTPVVSLSCDGECPFEPLFGVNETKGYESRYLQGNVGSESDSFSSERWPIDMKAMLAAMNLDILELTNFTNRILFAGTLPPPEPDPRTDGDETLVVESASNVEGEGDETPTPAPFNATDGLDEDNPCGEIGDDVIECIQFEDPSEQPSESSSPSVSPSVAPSESLFPSAGPSMSPTSSSVPSAIPSASPSESLYPSISSSSVPTESTMPSGQPSRSPSQSSHPSLERKS